MQLVKTSDRLPPQYKSVLVIHKNNQSVMRHEGGWWYGLSKTDQPDYWFECSLLDGMLVVTNKLHLGVLHDC